MSIAASDTTTPHVHGLKDDLESLLYVVLYCALLWLPVTSSSKLDWWLTDFFGVPNPSRKVGAPSKLLNAITRFYTNDLTSTRSQAVLNWLNATMDLHYRPMGRPGSFEPNPDWDDGKALETMWEETLAEELPSDDRHENPVPTRVMREVYSLHATYTTQTTSMSLYGSHVFAIRPPPSTSSGRASSKRSISESLGGDNAPGLSDQTSKRRRLRKSNTRWNPVPYPYRNIRETAQIYQR